MRRLVSLLRSSGGQAIASSGIVLLLTVATGVISARFLEVEERGVTAAVLALAAMLAQAGNAGPAEAQLLAPQRGHPLGVTVRVTWLFSLVVVLLSTIPAVLYLFAMTAPDSLLVVIVATMPAVATIGLLCNYLLLGEKRYGASTLLRTLPIVLQTLALIIIGLCDAANVLTVIIASWIAGLLAGILGLLLAKPWVHAGGSFQQDGGGIMRLVVTVGGSHAIRIIGYRVDLILLGALAGGYAAGLYSVAISLTTAGNSLTANLTPLVTTRGSGEDSTRFTQASSLFAAVVATGIAALGPLGIPLIYGGNYAPGWLLIAILAAAMYGAFLFDTASRIFQRGGHERIALRTSILVIGIQIAAISAGSLALGATGAALGNLIAYGIGLLTLAVIARRRHDINGLAHQLSPFAGLRVLAVRVRRH